MNTLDWENYLKELQDNICQPLPPEQNLKIVPSELQNRETGVLKDPQTYENYLFSLSILFL